jgi:hypothetical protein
MKRLISLVVVAATIVLTTVAHASTYSTDISDFWWNASESGWGINVTLQNDVAFATFYVYDESQNPVWYSTDLHPIGNFYLDWESIRQPRTVVRRALQSRQRRPAASWHGAVQAKLRQQRDSDIHRQWRAGRKEPHANDVDLREPHGNVCRRLLHTRDGMCPQLT